ncbi:MAG: sensor histidine kinase [Planctomycetes bacterium]|nr:sensor histidine kinase [Planctomycetota bacterium]
MSLVTRLCAFALAGLAFVLIGFSGTLFLLARHYLIHRADMRLNTAMETLIAAVEVHPNDVEWEPLQRRITLGDDPSDDQVRWMIHDESGKLVDCSRNLESESHTFGFDNQTVWQFQVTRLKAGQFQSKAIAVDTNPFDEATIRRLALKPPGRPTGLPEDRTRQAQAFTLTAAIPFQPVASSIQAAAWTLAGISIGIWLVAALSGRWVCRRALAPVSCMAASARLLKASTPSLRLEVTTSGDELEQLGDAFNELLARLQATLERQERFTGDAAHQLRTPLTAVLGQVEVALRQRRSEEDYRKVLEIVQRRSLQLRQIIDALLFLARADEPSDIPDLHELDFGAWLHAYVAELSDHPRGQDIRWDDKLGACLVRGNPQLLDPLLSNLLDNACKYSKPGTPIEVVCRPKPDGVELTVKDEGCGIPAEDLPHVCEPFFRSPAARLGAYPGVGLGLAMVARIVSILGGRLNIFSKPGHGTQVAIWLPCNTVQPERREAAQLGKTDKGLDEMELINHLRN